MTKPRWKGKGSAAKAVGEPMSKIVSELESSLINSDSKAFVSGCSVLLEANSEQTELLNRACFGHPIITSQQDQQWFRLCLEEAFYMFYFLKCLKIKGYDSSAKNEVELWHLMSSKREMFPELCKAYSHLRMKNWVVRSGSQYGVDYVVYRHHPALVHSEYAVIVLSDTSDDADERLRVWSDFHCTTRLCGSVAKTLLVLHVHKNGSGTNSPMCLENYNIEEWTITRWNPEQNREDSVFQFDERTDTQI
ncbi:hypothetical protein Nepgr_008617 [Nepenthes gracilis]|uniref:tRNA-intron lyase n=1 Tax=Nepenthes gracilis TaxID=150966 RepID=A0AAD3XJE5_NEPGR|nr:hypothetical protein Nepgr_008617 [Nepenthes gracilis]